MGQCHHMGPEGKGGKTGRQMASEWQINSLPGLLAVKMIQQQNSLTNRPTHQSTTLMLRASMDIHKNSPVSVTKLTLGLRVGFISSHLTVNKLFSVNTRAIMGPPQMSLLLEAKSMPALIIKPRLIPVITQMTLVAR